MPKNSVKNGWVLRSLFRYEFCRYWHTCVDSVQAISEVRTPNTLVLFPHPWLPPPPAPEWCAHVTHQSLRFPPQKIQILKLLKLVFLHFS